MNDVNATVLRTTFVEKNAPIREGDTSLLRGYGLLSIVGSQSGLLPEIPNPLAPLLVNPKPRKLTIVWIAMPLCPTAWWREWSRREQTKPCLPLVVGC